MNCPKCGCEIPDGMHYCKECGTKVDVFLLCKKCGALYKGDLLFCPDCGNPSAFERVSPESMKQDEKIKPDVSGEDDAPVKIADMSALKKEISSGNPDAGRSAVNENNLEKTMTFPAIKSGAYRKAEDTDSVLNGKDPTSAIPVKATKPPVKTTAGSNPEKTHVSSGERKHTSKEAKPVHTSSSRKKNLEVQRQKNVLMFLIVFLLVILIGLASVILFVTLKGRNSVPAVDAPVDPVVKEVIPEVTEEETEEEPEEEPENQLPEEGESSLMETYHFEPDMDYDFVYSAVINPEEHTDEKRIYSEYHNDEYAYKYNIPNSFGIEESHSNSHFAESRYTTPDGTAYIDMGAKRNNTELSLQTVLDGTIDSLGGSAEYETSGNDWFAIRVQKNGIVYYQKCYVDEYIRYFEMVYPSEYSNIYDNYINEIESGFSRVTE